MDLNKAFERVPREELRHCIFLHEEVKTDRVVCESGGGLV